MMSGDDIPSIALGVVSKRGRGRGRPRKERNEDGMVKRENTGVEKTPFKKPVATLTYEGKLLEEQNRKLRAKVKKLRRSYKEKKADKENELSISREIIAQLRTQLEKAKRDQEEKEFEAKITQCLDEARRRTIEYQLRKNRARDACNKINEARSRPPPPPPPTTSNSAKLSSFKKFLAFKLAESMAQVKARSKQSAKKKLELKPYVCSWCDAGFDLGLQLMMHQSLFKHKGKPEDAAAWSKGLKLESSGSTCNRNV